MEDSVHEENVTTTPPVECVVSPKSHVDIDAVVITCAAIGTLLNVTAASVLLSRELGGAFYKILGFLALFDAAFLVSDAGRHAAGRTRAFPFFYFFQGTALVGSVYMTVGLAVERHLALNRPLEHLPAMQGNQLRRVSRLYAAPVATFALLFNLPKYFEVTFHAELGVPFPSELRLDDNYVIWYQCALKLLVTGLLPLAALAYFNLRVVMVLMRQVRVNRDNSLQMTAVNSGGGGGGGRNGIAHAMSVHRHPDAVTQASKAGRQQALLLFSVVVIFLLTNLPRIGLDVYETTLLGDPCRGPLVSGSDAPGWVLATSEMLLVANSSVNFLVYSMQSDPFRRALKMFFGCLACSCCRK